MNTVLNTTVTMIVTNAAGVDLGYGDVVISASSPARAVTRTTDVDYIGPVGVVIDPAGILNGGVGAVAWGGYVPRINLLSAAAINDRLMVSATPGSAQVVVSASSPAFAAALSAGSTPEAILTYPKVTLPTSGTGLIALPTPTPLTLINGVQSYNTEYGGSTYPEPSYWIDPFGMVHLTGVVGTTSNGVTLATLPVGYRPARSLIFDVRASNNNGRLDIIDDGSINPQTSWGGWASLDGVLFLVASSPSSLSIPVTIP